MKKYNPIQLVLFLCFVCSCTNAQTNKLTSAKTEDKDKLTVAAYYFPNYHTDDARNTEFKGEGWAEWELVKSATPRFPGEHQPNVPAWGYTDEKDPKVMAQKIDAAVNHGVDTFIFDW